ncbi:MAG: PIN domain-containing protein [Solirubrobacteraceae bacterium]
MYRACRRGGETIRTMLDCVIAAVAIREHAELLHHDRDFDAIARHTPLRLARAGARPSGTAGSRQSIPLRPPLAPPGPARRSTRRRR